MNEYIIRLLPRSSLQGRLTSDTLFGALCWAIRTIYGESSLVEMLKGFNEKPRFLISSAFPFKIVGGQERYYLPKPKYPSIKTSKLMDMAEKRAYQISLKPYHSQKIFKINIIEKYNEFQKLEWISMEVFDWIAHKGCDGENILFQEFLGRRLSQPFWRRQEVVQKNALDRLTGSTGGAGNTFYNQESFLPENIGLYFLLKAEDFAFIQPALRFLEDSGIGPNAYTGKNHFQIMWEEKEITTKTSGEFFVTLSRYTPNSNVGFDSDRSYYEVEFIRSKVHSREEFMSEDVWKDRIVYLKEGSIIALERAVDPIGGIYPVKELHGTTIFQYGFAYPYWGNFGKEKT